MASCCINSATLRLQAISLPKKDQDLCLNKYQPVSSQHGYRLTTKLIEEEK